MEGLKPGEDVSCPREIGLCFLGRSPLWRVKTRSGRKLAATFHGDVRRAQTGDRWQLEDAHDLCPVAGVHGGLPAFGC